MFGWLLVTILCPCSLGKEFTSAPKEKLFPVSDYLAKEDTEPLKIWSLKFRRHLKDEELEEWASLTNLLPGIQLTDQPDCWIWKLETMVYFYQEHY